MNKNEFRRAFEFSLYDISIFIVCDIRFHIGFLTSILCIVYMYTWLVSMSKLPNFQFRHTFALCHWNHQYNHFIPCTNYRCSMGNMGDLFKYTTASSSSQARHQFDVLVLEDWTLPWKSLCFLHIFPVIKNLLFYMMCCMQREQITFKVHYFVIIGLFDISRNLVII